MLGTKNDLKKGLGALPGLVVIILILSMPSLSNLPIISMWLCLTSIGYIVTVSLRTSGDERKRTIKEFAEHRKERLNEIRYDIANADHNLSQASRQTLKREAQNLQAKAALQEGSAQDIENDIKFGAKFGSLQPIAQRALLGERDRLAKLTSIKETPEDSALIVGIAAIFAIINGLGLSEALGTYFGSLHVNPTLHDSLIQMVTLNWPHTYRIVGFLAMIIPFIHGFVLTITTKWYHDPIKDLYHFRLAYLFFIAVFIHTVLFYLLAIKGGDISHYILFIWSILLFNILWLPIQSILTSRILRRNDAFLHEWIILNFNTVAYLAVFIFAYPALLAVHNTVGEDEYLNFQIVLVLVFRTVADYFMGWRKIYNKQT